MQIKELQNKHKNQTCYIVGKGASLDLLNTDNFRTVFNESGPIICINQTIRIIEDVYSKLQRRKNFTNYNIIRNKIYSIQQDGLNEYIEQPQSATLLTNTKTLPLFQRNSNDEIPVPYYLYDQTNDLGILDGIITAVSALAIAKKMGCKKIIFIAFDSVTEDSDKHPKFFVQEHGIITAKEKYHRFFNVIKLHLGKFQIPGSFKSIIKSQESGSHDPGSHDPGSHDPGSHNYDVAPYVIVTTTRDRKVAMNICRELVCNQTILPLEWIIVDDGNDPLQLKDYVGATYIRRIPKINDPKHTAKVNLLEAFEYIKNKYSDPELPIFSFEDDDYYSNRYIETYLPYLRSQKQETQKQGSCDPGSQKQGSCDSGSCDPNSYDPESHDLVGTQQTTIYNLEHRMYKTYTDLDYCTYSCSAFKRKLLPIVAKICMDQTSYNVDVTMWRTVAKNRSLLFATKPVFVGVKGLPGLRGLTTAHKLDRLLKQGFQIDRSLKIFKSLVKEDFKYYEHLNLKSDRVIIRTKRPVSYPTPPETIEHNVLAMNIRGKIMGTRILSNGCIALTYKDAKAMNYLDQHYNRVNGSLIWRPKSSSRDINDLKSLFEGKECYIIGKGPSLDAIDESCFKPNCPIICINESVFKIDSLDVKNPIFSCQQDERLKNTCLGESKNIILDPKCQWWYADIDSKYVVDYKIKHPYPTVAIAINVAKQLCANKIIMYAFDAITNANCNYAKCIGYRVTGKPERFLGQHKRIMSELQGINHEIVDKSLVTK